MSEEKKDSEIEYNSEDIENNDSENEDSEIEDIENEELNINNKNLLLDFRYMKTIVNKFSYNQIISFVDFFFAFFVEKENLKKRKKEKDPEIDKISKEKKTILYTKLMIILIYNEISKKILGEISKEKIFYNFSKLLVKIKTKIDNNNRKDEEENIDINININDLYNNYDNDPPRYIEDKKFFISFFCYIIQLIIEQSSKIPIIQLITFIYIFKSNIDIPEENPHPIRCLDFCIQLTVNKLLDLKGVDTIFKYYNENRENKKIKFFDLYMHNTNENRLIKPIIDSYITDSLFKLYRKNIDIKFELLKLFINNGLKLSLDKYDDFIIMMLYDNKYKNINTGIDILTTLIKNDNEINLKDLYVDFIDDKVIENEYMKYFKYKVLDKIYNENKNNNDTENRYINTVNIKNFKKEYFKFETNKYIKIKLKNNIIVYRAATVSLEKNKNKTEIFDYKNYKVTFYSLEDALNYTNKDTNCCIYEITLPSGSIITPVIITKENKEIPMFYLPNDSKFRYTNKYKIKIDNNEIQAYHLVYKTPYEEKICLENK